MSYVGTPTQLSKVVDFGSAVSVSSPNLIIKLPDGSTFTSAAMVSPSGSSNPKTFSLQYIPTMGGLHIARFQGVINGSTLNFGFTFFPTWMDVNTDIRGLLGTSSRSQPDSKLDPTTSRIITYLQSYAPEMPLYYTFNTVYQVGFDQALALLVASRVRPYLGGKRPTGEVSLLKKGTTTAQYSVGSPRMASTIEDQWWAQGMDILSATIPEMTTAIEADRPGDEVMTRGSLAPGNYHPHAPWEVYPRGGIYGQSGLNPLGRLKSNPSGHDHGNSEF